MYPEIRENRSRQFHTVLPDPNLSCLTETKPRKQDGAVEQLNRESQATISQPPVLPPVCPMLGVHRMDENAGAAVGSRPQISLRNYWPRRAQMDARKQSSPSSAKFEFIPH